MSTPSLRPSVFIAAGKTLTADGAMEFLCSRLTGAEREWFREFFAPTFARRTGGLWTFECSDLSDNCNGWERRKHFYFQVRAMACAFAAAVIEDENRIASKKRKATA